MFLTQPAFVISGPSGVGKESIIKAVMASLPNLYLVPSWTTRAPRPNDSGKYVYVTAEEFKAAADQGRFLEWEYYGDHQYGTYLHDAPRDADLIIEINHKGALNLKAKYTSLITTIFILPPSRQALEERLRGRGADSPAEMAKRLALAPEEVKHAKHFENWIENDNLEETVRKLRFVMTTKRDHGRVGPTYKNPFILDRVLKTFREPVLAN